MKSIELTAYAVREYDVKYTVVLDETDPFLQELLINNGLKFDDLDTLDYADYKDLWETIMTFDDVQAEEDFGMADERLVDFEAFVSESA
jgi:hypothetical protein